MTTCAVCEVLSPAAVNCPDCARWLCTDCWGSIADNRNCGLCQAGVGAA
jgi:hypothetical protein